MSEKIILNPNQYIYYKMDIILLIFLLLVFMGFGKIIDGIAKDIKEIKTHIIEISKTLKK
jgi:hypothetical protein